MTQDQHTPANSDGSPEAGCARRSVLRGALALGAVGLGGGLSACGGGSSDSASQSSGASGAGTSGSGSSGATSGPTSASTPTPAATSAGASGAGTSLGPASGVPVGGGTVYSAAKVVVTQPSMGQYKAFTAVCTHEQCTVGDVSTTINCPCHGSEFSITDGSVVRGPAAQPLAAKTVTVSGGNISVT